MRGDKEGTGGGGYPMVCIGYIVAADGVGADGVSRRIVQGGEAMLPRDWHSWTKFREVRERAERHCYDLEKIEVMTVRIVKEELV